MTHIPSNMTELIEVCCSECPSVIFAPQMCIDQIGASLVENNYQKHRKEMCGKTFGKDGTVYEELIRVACRPDRVLQWTDDLEFYEQLT
jgi:hypothetical protein